MERHRSGNFSSAACRVVLALFIWAQLLSLITKSGRHSHPHGALAAETHYLDFILAEKNFTRLCSNKTMLVVNGMLPGPTIRVAKGDTVYINVVNNGSFGVTLHWHGVKLPRNPWSDGPDYITQCPIQAGGNFTYELNFSSEEGTVWWHAHSDWTRASVHGAIVVYPAEGTSYPFPEPDGEELLVLGSWYVGDVREMVTADLETGDALPSSDAYIINGQPGDFCACSSGSTYRWHVDYGKTYHLRIVNAAMNAPLFLAIAGHNLTVVGSDGSYLKPFDTSYIVISPGSTVDALLVADQTPSHYYAVARQYKSGDLSFPYDDNSNASAVLMYNGNYTAPDTPEYPTTIPSSTDADAATDFVALLRSLVDEDHPIDVPLNITTGMFVTTSVNQIIDKGTNTTRTSASLNNMSWVDADVDVLMAYYRNLSGFYTTDFPDEPGNYFDFTADYLPKFSTAYPDRGTRLKVLEFGEEVEMVFQDTNVLNGSMTHPMHLHGYSFYVIGQGDGNFNAETDPDKYNLVDPPQLNTIATPRNGWVAIRFKANNPGVWLLHCHLDRHYSVGMNTVFIVKNGPTSETSIREPPPDMPSCGSPESILDEAFAGGDESFDG